MLKEFTAQQARFDSAFARGATSCSTTCDACGRIYFVTSPGHGDYEPGELDRLRELANDFPDKYIEVHDFGSVSYSFLDGKHVVIGCLCDPTKGYSDSIEEHARELTTYLLLYWRDKQAEADQLAKTSREAILMLAPQGGL